MRKWEAGERSSVNYCIYMWSCAGYEDLDKIRLKWFTRTRSKNIPVSGRVIQTKILTCAKELGQALRLLPSSNTIQQ